MYIENRPFNYYNLPFMAYHIYILDSNLQHAEKIKDHLKSYEDYHIHIFNKVSECIEQFKLHPPAVVFLDDELKHDTKTVKKHIEIMKELKAASPATEVVLFTGEEHVEVLSQNLKEGALNTIVKSHSSHLRVENEILQAIRHYKAAQESKFLGKIVKIVTWSVGIIIIVSLILWKMGIIRSIVSQEPF